MTQLIGIDVGGTNTRIRVQSAEGGDRATAAILSSDWLAAGGLGDPAGAAVLVARAYELGATPESPLAIGAHGCDSPAEIAGLRAALEANHAGPVTVVNDAFLLAPAAGVDRAIGVIAGTGSIVVGAGPSGDLLTAGGIGWMLGDPGSAPALARESLRKVFDRHDEGLEADELGRRMLEFYGYESVEELTLGFTRKASIHHWAAFAPIVFEAADAGSRDAVAVVDEAAAGLAKSVAQLLARGVDAEAIVTAGGVIVHQPRLQRALETALEDTGVGLPLRVLTDDPVSGAVELARRSLAPDQTLTSTATI